MTSAVVERRAAVPDFFDGAHAQAIADAVLEVSEDRGSWHPVPAPSRGDNGEKRGEKRCAELELSSQPHKRAQSALRLAGKNAIVTGAGSGMGRGITLAFAAEGVD